MYANAPLRKENKLPNALISQEHTIVDLARMNFTVGRLHPMMDNDLRIRRLLEEAQDPSVAVIMLDVVIGYGSHPNPASELGPAIVKARALAEKAGRYLEVAAVVTGTDEDPQNFDEQIRLLKDAGALGQSQQRRYGPLHWSHPPGFGPGFSVPVSVVKNTHRTFQPCKKPLEQLRRAGSFAENLVAQGVLTTLNRGR